MSRDRPGSMSPEETRAREELRRLPVVDADAAYRERLKHDFVTGRIGSRRALTLAAPWYRRALRWAVVAPAALATLAATAWIADRGPGWTVMATRGEAIATVDGAPVALTSHEDLAGRLRRGARLAVPAGAELELASAGGLVVQVTGGTELTLPGTPGRWLRRRVSGAVHRGEIRITTGPAFTGARLRVATPEAAVEVTGTTFAVICEPAGTCVCVYEGTVRVGPRGGRMDGVPHGRRRFVFSDGRPPESGEIRPVELARLAQLRDRRREWLEKDGR